MADLRDEFGNPIQITDEHGNPVRLTDEYGNPIHITGVATSRPLAAAPPETISSHEKCTLGEALKAEGGSGEHDKGRDEGEVREEKEGKDESPGEIQRSSSSSSSSSEEDDGQGGRRKKKELKQKIKEKLTGGKHKEERMEEQGHITENVTGATKADEEQKKGVMEKIKDMLPGHHSH